MTKSNPRLCRCEHPKHAGQCPAPDGCWCDTFTAHVGNYVKVWFSGPAGETARLVVQVSDLDKGIAHLSRLFPYSESRKMSKIHTSPEFATYQQAFLWEG